MNIENFSLTKKKECLGTEDVIRQNQGLLHEMFCMKPMSYNNYTKNIFRPEYIYFLDCIFDSLGLTHKLDIIKFIKFSL